MLDETKTTSVIIDVSSLTLKAVSSLTLKAEAVEENVKLGQSKILYPHIKLLVPYPRA